jgi:hypothetical protein
MLKQAFAQVRQIPVGITGWRYPLVYLNNMDGIPLQILERESSKHEPRSVSSADSHYKRAVVLDCFPGFAGNESGRFRGSGVCACRDLDFHLVVPPLWSIKVNVEHESQSSIQAARLSRVKES